MKKNNKSKFEEYQIFGTNYLRNHAYENGENIYDFMKKHGIGENAYGKLMDYAGKKEAVHRLYGHHLVYDFPISERENIPSFLTHEFSDLPTKQGLPLLPGEILENADLIKYCKSLSHNWNFLNGFDLLTATVSIYHGFNKLKTVNENDLSIDTFTEVAKFIGVGTVELAIAFSTANPFLLIGASLRIIATMKGILNNSAIVFFKQYQDHLTIHFQILNNRIEENISNNSIGYSMNQNSIKKSIDSNSVN